MPLTPKRVLRTFRYAVYFDGVDDYVRISLPSSLTGSASFTVMFCLSFYFQPRRIWVLWYGTPGKYTVVHFLINPDGLTQFGFFDGVQNSISVKPYEKVFTFYATRYDNISSLLESFINGNKVDSDTVTTTPNVQPGYIYIGCPAPTFRESYLKGYIAQVLIYTRTLSDSEIQWNYQYPDNPVRNGLVLWLQAHPDYVKDIDGDGVLEWIDLSGFGNHGKIYGAQLVQLIKTPSRVLKPARVLKPMR